MKHQKRNDVLCGIPSGFKCTLKNLSLNKEQNISQLLKNFLCTYMVALTTLHEKILTNLLEEK